MANGNKVNLQKYLTILGIVLLLIINFTKITDRIGDKSTTPVLLAQDVKAIDGRVGTVEIDMKANNAEDNKQRTDIEVLKNKVDNAVKVIEAQTIAQNKTNDLLFQIVQKLPNE